MSSLEVFPQLCEGSKFSNWKFRLNILFEEKGIEYLLNGKKDENLKKETYKKDDAKGRLIIINCLNDKFLEVVKPATSALEMLKLLSAVFERRSTFNKVLLRKKLITLKHQFSNKLQDHLINFENIINELEGGGAKIEELDKVEHLFITLPKEYDTIINTLESLDKELNFEFVKCRLLDLENKLKENSIEEKTENMFITNTAIICFKCKHRGHKSFQCNLNNNMTNNNDMKNFITHNNRESNRGSVLNNKFFNRGFNNNYNRGRGYNNNYMNSGHRYNNNYTRQVRGYNNNYMNKGRGRHHNFSRQANTTEEFNLHEENKSTFVALTLENEFKESNDILFIIDSGATHHFIQEKYEKYMYDIQLLDEPMKIKIANGQFLIANKKGKLEGIYKNKIIVINGIIVPEISHNLISVSKLMEKGMTIIIKQEQMKIYTNDAHSNTHHIYKEGKLFTMRMLIKQNAQCNQSIDKNDIWHKRLGHLNRKSLQLMDLPFSDKICNECMINKSTRKPFYPVTKPQSHAIGDLIHSDIAGPMKTTTNEGERYYQTIIDDYSHFTFTYLLKNKSEAAQNLIDYIKIIKTEKGIRVKKIRCDNGGELKHKKSVEALKFLLRRSSRRAPTRMWQDSRRRLNPTTVKGWNADKGSRLECLHPYGPLDRKSSPLASLD
ncbi:unnamed protein product, partial [Brenthis ino]